MKPRILVTDDDAQLRAFLKDLLCEEFEVVGEAADGAESVRLAKELEPDLVLSDVQMPVMDGITATREISEACPGTVTVVLSADKDSESMRKALAAGARDYVTKPFQAHELLDTLQQVWVQHAARQRVVQATQGPPGAGIWSFLRATGGTGATTLVLALANELASIRHRVLVVDLNLHFGHVPFLLQLDLGGRHLGGLAGIDPHDADAAFELTVEHPSGIRVLAPPSDAMQAHALVPEQVAAAVSALRGRFDYVLVDHPVGIPDAFLPVIDASGFVYLVTNGSTSAMGSMGKLLNLMLRLDYPLHKFRPVLTGFRADESVRRMFDGVLAKVDSSVSQVFPYDLEAVDRAVEQGQPVTRVDPKSPFSRAVREFLVPILEISVRHGSEAPRAREERSFFERVFDFVAGGD